MKKKGDIEQVMGAYANSISTFRHDSIRLYSLFIHYLVNKCEFDINDFTYVASEDIKNQNSTIINLPGSFYITVDKKIEGNCRFIYTKEYGFHFVITKNGNEFTIVNKYGGTPTTISDFSDSSISAIVENFTEDFYRLFDRDPFSSSPVKGGYIGFRSQA